MKSFVGFIFTSAPIENLERRGFVFEQNENTLTQGYRAFILNLQGPNQTPSQIQLRQILDEESYRQHHKIQHFQPHRIDDSLILQPTVTVKPQENSVHRLEKFLGPANMKDGELKTYLHLRKAFDLWALCLQCQDFSVFEKKAKPDRFFEYEEKKTALIHLGPNCFDFLIST